MRLSVITGGPGVGKTTLLNALAKKGYSYVPEVARYLIGKGYNPRDEGFQEKVVKKQLEWEREYVHATLCDRGVIDSAGYCEYFNMALAKNFPQDAADRYARVFILDLLPNYVNDSERDETLEEASAKHKEIIEAYKRYGYDPIFVPAIGVEKRVDFVIKELGIERERKFLVYENGIWYCDPLKIDPGRAIRQGYLDASGSGFDAVRVREEGSRYYLTKKRGKGQEHFEEEREISAEEFERLWTNTLGKRVFKERSRWKGFEIDRFCDRELILAEAENRTISIGKEVTHDGRYYNVNLAR